MKWLFRWLGDKIHQAKQESEDVGFQLNSARPKRRNTLVATSDNTDIRTEPIAFKMYRASGGWAIEFSQYDNRNDKWDSSLYVVNDEHELGTQISQIITMEALKR